MLRPCQQIVIIWGELQYRIPLENSSQTQISRNLVHPQHFIWLPNRFENLHRAWQWHCHALCKISKWFDKQMISYGQMWFHKIEVEYAFQTDILHCDSPWPRLLHKQYIPAMQYCVADWFHGSRTVNSAGRPYAILWCWQSVLSWLDIELSLECVNDWQ